MASPPAQSARIWTSSRVRSVLIGANALGCLLSALLLVSTTLTWLVLAFTAWGIEALIQSGLGAAIAVIAVGVWFGIYHRVPAALGLTAGNGAVLFSFAANLLVPVVVGPNMPAIGIAIYVGALLELFGYAVLAGTLARLLFRALARLR